MHPISKVRAADITPATLAAFRDERLALVKPGTVLKELNIIRAAMNRAIDWGIAVPVVKVKRPKAPAARDRVLREDEEGPLLAACLASTNVYLHGAVVFALETAMRQGEILSLRRDSIDWDRRTCRLHDTKNGCARDVPLSSRALAVLRSLPGGSDCMFDTLDLSHAFIRAVRAAKIPHIRFHDLRHTACSRLARKLTTVQLQAVSGHKTLAMLQRYVHLRADDIVSLLD
ncbi:tyrosine-type recombinase/integrase [Paraburkholderia sp. GAS41]|uniref:tyrosine-type recombinase/integrase n=1 Tax=Paraburkholderia sp. GAS41 TaxID=3035134 RepID=UPI003D1E6B5E